jgi:hypothetical protein
MRLDESRLEALRQWGQALRDAGGEESVAAGRAILMLIDELERVHLELRLAGEQSERADQVPDNETEAGTSDPVSSRLHQRVQRVLRRDSDRSGEGRLEPVERIGSTVDLETDSSAQSWIETLRRQK